jgi:hypothetical protein
VALQQHRSRALTRIDSDASAAAGHGRRRPRVNSRPPPESRKRPTGRRHLWPPAECGQPGSMPAGRKFQPGLWRHTGRLHCPAMTRNPLAAVPVFQVATGKAPASALVALTSRVAAATRDRAAGAGGAMDRLHSLRASNSRVQALRMDFKAVSSTAGRLQQVFSRC